jgi:hypothetical protein
MAHQPVAKLACNLMLEPLNFGIVEVDNLTSLQIDQMVVMFAPDHLVAQSAAPKSVTFNNSLARKELQRPVDGRAGYAWVPFGDASTQLLSVRMVFRFSYDLND